MIQTCIDRIRDVEIQQTLRLENLRKLEEALSRVLDNEATKQESKTYLKGQKTYLYHGRKMNSSISAVIS